MVGREGVGSGRDVTVIMWSTGLDTQTSLEGSLRVWANPLLVCTYVSS